MHDGALHAAGRDTTASGNRIAGAAIDPESAGGRTMAGTVSRRHAGAGGRGKSRRRGRRARDAARVRAAAIPGNDEAL